MTDAHKTRLTLGMDLIDLLAETARQRASLHVFIKSSGESRFAVTAPAAVEGARLEASGGSVGGPLRNVFRQLRDNARSFDTGLPEGSGEALALAGQVAELLELAAERQVQVTLRADFHPFTGASYTLSFGPAGSPATHTTQAGRLSDTLFKTIPFLRAV